MSAGLPVIASDFPRWREIIDPYEAGLLVDPLDPAAIADAIAALLRDPARGRRDGPQRPGGGGRSVRLGEPGRRPPQRYRSLIADLVAGDALRRDEGVPSPGYGRIVITREPADPPPRNRSVRDWMRVFRDGWFAFVVVLAAAIAAATLVTLRQPTLYGAKGILVVSPVRGFIDPSGAGNLSTIADTIRRLPATDALTANTLARVPAGSRVDPTRPERRRRVAGLGRPAA